MSPATTPPNPAPEKCPHYDAFNGVSSMDIIPCVLNAGHYGLHSSGAGHWWSYGLPTFDPAMEMSDL